jgi:FkbM family methyltransferase
MKTSDSDKKQRAESTCKVYHPAIGELYCLSAPEARVTLHEVCEENVYLQEGISISPGDVVIDVGANIGVFTLYAAERGAHVYSYEPVAPTYAVLTQNVESHGLLDKVRTHNVGLSDRREAKKMFHYPRLSVCDAWSPQDRLLKYMLENWRDVLAGLERADTSGPRDKLPVTDLHADFLGPVTISGHQHGAKSLLPERSLTSKWDTVVPLVIIGFGFHRAHIACRFQDGGFRFVCSGLALLPARRPE